MDEEFPEIPKSSLALSIKLWFFFCSYNAIFMQNNTCSQTWFLVPGIKRTKARYRVIERCQSNLSNLKNQNIHGFFDAGIIFDLGQNENNRKHILLRICFFWTRPNRWVLCGIRFCINALKGVTKKVCWYLGFFFDAGIIFDFGAKRNYQEKYFAQNLFL